MDCTRFRRTRRRCNELPNHARQLSTAPTLGSMANRESRKRETNEGSLFTRRHKGESGFAIYMGNKASRRKVRIPTKAATYSNLIAATVPT